MMKEERPEYDYLEMLIQEQIMELRQFGPIVYDVFSALQPHAAIKIEDLVESILSHDQLVVIGTADGLALRSQPSISDSTLIKRLPQGAKLFVIEPGGESKIGMQSQWLRVSDYEGHQGYVAAWYVTKVDFEEDNGVVVDKVMNLLEYSIKLDLVKFIQKGEMSMVSLTPKGKQISELLLR